MAVRRSKTAAANLGGVVDPAKRVKYLLLYAVALRSWDESAGQAPDPSALAYRQFVDRLRYELDPDPVERLQRVEAELDRLGLRDGAERFILKFYRSKVVA